MSRKKYSDGEVVHKRGDYTIVARISFIALYRTTTFDSYIHNSVSGAKQTITERIARSRGHSICECGRIIDRKRKDKQL